MVYIQGMANDTGEQDYEVNGNQASMDIGMTSQEPTNDQPKEELKMGIKITSIAEAVSKQGLKILVYGDAGSGKTVLSATSGKPTLILSAEAGLLSIKDAPDYVQTTLIETFADLEDAYCALMEGVDFDWVCIDSISEIAEVVLHNELEKSVDPRKAYPGMQSSIQSMIKKIRDTPRYHVLVTAKMQRFTDDHTGITSYIPMMPGTKLPQSLPYLFDEVFALRMLADDEGNEHRVLQTEKDYSYVAKDRSGKLSKFEKPNLGHITHKILGE